jgi:hypothetical protein
VRQQFHRKGLLNQYETAVDVLRQHLPGRQHVIGAGGKRELSLIVSLFCAIAQPIQIIDESLMTNAGRANLCLAVVDTIIVEDANDLAG